jgi:hypothetical protein
MEEHAEIGSVLAALYLEGLPGRPRLREGPASSQWRLVWSVLRREAAPGFDAQEVLSRFGYAAEACVLGVPGLLDTARGLVHGGTVLTAEDPRYPWHHRSTIGPAALWQGGAFPRDVLARAPGLVAVVGSRRPSPAAREFVDALAREVVRAGLALVSGGAIGCDALAQASAYADGGVVVEILPFGLTWPVGWRYGPSTVTLSPFAPHEAFSRATAMARNTLIYGAGRLSIVVEPRYREGGSWHGATDALRRRLGPVAVWLGPDETPSRATQALLALGAVGLRHPIELSVLLSVDGEASASTGACRGSFRSPKNLPGTPSLPGLIDGASGLALSSSGC